MSTIIFHNVPLSLSGAYGSEPNRVPTNPAPTPAASGHPEIWVEILSSFQHPPFAEIDEKINPYFEEVGTT